MAVLVCSIETTVELGKLYIYQRRANAKTPDKYKDLRLVKVERIRASNRLMFYIVGSKII
jgi:hypothetical protein